MCVGDGNGGEVPQVAAATSYVDGSGAGSCSAWAEKRLLASLPPLTLPTNTSEYNQSILVGGIWDKGREVVEGEWG